MDLANNETRPPGPLFGMAVIATALLALGVSGYLTWVHWHDGTVAGCGTGCAAVAASRWSAVFAVVPVAACGALAWLFLLGCAVLRRWGAALLCSGVIAGGALWFAFVQAAVLGRFCRWCVAAHLLGAVAACLLLWCNTRAVPAGRVWGRFGLCAGVAFLMIGLSQVFGPQPTTHKMAEIARSESAPVQERGEGRKVSFANGSKTYNVESLPHLGPVGARCVIVEYFDYTCAACHTMLGFIEALRAKHPDDICVVLLPVPLGHDCNKTLPPSDPDHPGSCEITHLAMALWRAEPRLFQEMHASLMRAPSPDAARAMVLDRADPAAMGKAMVDPWVSALLAANIRDWRRFSDPVPTLPKLLITGRRMMHGLPSGEADFIRVMELELGL